MLPHNHGASDEAADLISEPVKRSFSFLLKSALSNDLGMNHLEEYRVRAGIDFDLDSFDMFYDESVFNLPKECLK